MTACCALGPSQVLLGQRGGRPLSPSALSSLWGGGYRPPSLNTWLRPRSRACSVTWVAGGREGTRGQQILLSDVTFPNQKWAVLSHSWECVLASSACTYVCVCVCFPICVLICVCHSGSVNVQISVRLCCVSLYIGLSHCVHGVLLPVSACV